MSVPIPKKMVSRSVAVLLGIVCVVLVAGLVGAVVYYNSYVSNHSHNNADYDYLNSQYQAMWVPQLIEVNLVGTQNSGFFSSPWLNVNGYIVNIHPNSAYNCQLHVVAYQSGVTVIDTYIQLGTIAGEGYYQVNSNIYYTSGGISSYTITPLWNDTQ